MKIARIETGFLEVPDKISLNIYSIGCSIQCPNCHNKHLWDFNNKNSYDLKTEEFENTIKSKKDIIKWVCFLGGEPLDQLCDTLLFARISKDENIHTCLYSGYSFDVIKQKLPDEYLYAFDLIISEPFVEIPVTQEHTNQKIFINTGDQVYTQINSWVELNTFLQTDSRYKKN